MTKQLLITSAFCLPLLAQVSPPGNAFQQNGWLHVPNVTGGHITSASIDGQSGPIIGKPVSADEVRHTEQLLSDGSHIRHDETEHFYRDSLGRMRTESATGALIFDPVTRFTYDLTTSRKTYFKYPNSEDQVVTIAAAASRSSTTASNGHGKQESATVTEELAPQLVNGVTAKGARLTSTIPAGTLGNDHDLKVVNERWYSDDLKLLVKSSNSDPRFGLATYELTNISQAEPDPALFQIPAGYTEGHR